MEIFKQKLYPILEQDNNNDLCIELTYFPDNIPSIKSYYFMTPSEYEELKSLHLDLYIENFIENEELTKDKLDIYLINNSNNINIIRNFINIFGNPFDILTIIHSKKNNKCIVNNDIIVTEFSESSDEPIIKPKKKNYSADIDSDSDEYINTMTEIIETFNKSKTVDEIKLSNIINNPEIQNDNIFSEIINNI